MRGAAVVAFLCFCSLDVHAQAMNGSSTQNQELQAVLDYISSSWSVLRRSTATCEAIADPKLTEVVTLYLPADLAIPDGLQNLPRECNVQVQRLPRIVHGAGQVTGNGIHPPGLLFLENPYVVPGGRFNEMYGWDSYFIIRGPGARHGGKLFL
jgi:alpha,alpha-trehalase